MMLIAWRTVRAQWRGLAATVAAVGLAVGLVVGCVQFTERVFGVTSAADASAYAAADVVVRADLGRSVDDGALEQVAGTRGVQAVAPDAQVPVTVSSSEGDPLAGVLGNPTTLRPWAAEPELNPYRVAAGRAPRTTDEVVVDRALAGAAGLTIGARVPLVFGTGVRSPVVVGTVTVGERDAAATGSVVLGVEQLVRDAGALGSGWPGLTVSLEPGATASALAPRLDEVLGGARTGVRAIPADVVRDDERTAAAELAGGLGSALATLALVGAWVGVFVVSGALRTLVQQRVRHLALLRVVGATPRRVRRLVRAESALVGTLGGAVGLAVSSVVAHGLAVLLERDGFGLDGGGVGAPGPVTVAAAVVAGPLTALVAARRAGREASRVAPVAVLREVQVDRTARSWWRAGWGAVLTCGAVGLLLGAVAVRRSDSPDAGLGAAQLVVFAGLVATGALAVLAPFLVGPVGGLVGSVAVAVRGEVGRLARATIVRNPRRVASTTSILLVSVMLATVGALLLSAGDRLLGAGAGRDLRVTHAVTTDGVSGSGPGLPAGLVEEVRSVAGVQQASGLYDTAAEALPASGRDAGAGSDADADSRARPAPVTGVDPEVMAGLWQPDSGGRSVRSLGDGELMVETTTAADNGWDVGSEVRVAGPGRERTMRVVATYTDDAGVLPGRALATRAAALALDPGAGVRSVLVAAEGDAGVVADRLRDVAERPADAAPGARVLERDAYLESVGGRAITGEGLLLGFLGMAVVISVAGLVVMLSLSVSERTREFGLLRAVGGLPEQVRSVVRWEAATVVTLGTVGGVGLGWATVVAVREVADVPALDAGLSPGWLGAIVAAATVLTLAASALPARRAGRAAVLDAVRAE
ncbi:MAG: FtsX-like permease family protein [Phycicoccus sp.]